jgi:hypothetical protein
MCWNKHSSYSHRLAAVPRPKRNERGTVAHVRVKTCEVGEGASVGAIRVGECYTPGSPKKQVLDFSSLLSPLLSPLLYPLLSLLLY